MNHDERRLADWLQHGPERPPADGLARTLAATRQVRQRPAWSVSEWWLPTGHARWSGPIPRLVLVALLAVALLGALVAISAARRGIPAPPFGLARDGEIAYVVNVPDPVLGHPLGGTLYLADPDGGHARPVSGTRGIDIHPQFSADGSTLAFSSREPSGDWFLYAASADGSGAHPVSGRRRNGNPAAPSYFTPTLSPDGGQVAYDDLDPQTGASVLYVVDAHATPAPSAITDGSADAYFPRWSPDGRWIAVVSYAPARCFLGTGPCAVSFVAVHPDGTGRRTLLEWRGWFPGPDLVDWLPDSSGLTIAWPAADYRYDPVAPAAGHIDLREARLDGTGAVLRSVPADHAFDGQVSPDGAWLANNTPDQVMVRPRAGDGEPFPLLSATHRLDDTPQGGLTLWTGCWLVGWSPEGEVVVLCDEGLSLIPDPTERGADHTPRLVVPLERGPMFGTAWQRLAP